MSSPIIEVRNLSKCYRLGQIGARSLREAVENQWGNVRGRLTRKGTAQAAELKPANDATEFWALKDISFDIEPGAVVGLIGGNGAGKSTLLKILSRITEPTTGEGILRGRVASLLEVGTGFHPELTGRENVFLNGAILGLKRTEIASRFDEIVAFSEIEKFIDTPVKRYSSGMYVRLAFAVAAHLEPEILIVDEVLAVGDQAFQQKCIGKMQDVATNSGRTVLFVSHHMASIRRLCHKCLILSKGRCSPLVDVNEGVERYNALYRANVSDHAVDTSGSRREDGRGQHVRIVKIEAVGDSPLQYGESLRVKVTIDAKKPAQDVMVGIAFETPEGARTMTLDSDAGGVLYNLSAGRHEVLVELDSLPLHPGQYVMHASAATGKHYHDTILRFAVWEVQTGKTDYVSDRGFGGCRIVPRVSYSPIADSPATQSALG